MKQDKSQCDDICFLDLVKDDENFPVTVSRARRTGEVECLCTCIYATDYCVSYNELFDVFEFLYQLMPHFPIMIMGTVRELSKTGHFLLLIKK